MINYNNKKFRSVSNTGSGEVSSLTTFHYKQENELITASYSGGEILAGQLIGTVDDQGCISMRYQHLNKKKELMHGICFSKPTILDNGKIQLHESWQWTSGDKSKGESIIEEI